MISTGAADSDRFGAAKAESDFAEMEASELRMISSSLGKRERASSK
jgi:hypothetical protein